MRQGQDQAALRVMARAGKVWQVQVRSGRARIQQFLAQARRGRVWHGGASCGLARGAVHREMPFGAGVGQAGLAACRRVATFQQVRLW
jgi:hypothetical protein